MVDKVDFHEFEVEVMRKILSGNDEVLDTLQKQYNLSRIKDREFSGTGFFTTFHLPNNAPRLKISKSFQIGDVIGQINGVEYGVGFVLFIKDGFLDILEGYTYGEEVWPSKILEYSLSYISGDYRDMEKLQLKWK
ncbi:MAG: hypothetical protein H0Z32_14310 [Bacillaceae bacterium]|nr:hypothetical protein [Bacillaceae bacterium]